MGAKYLASSGAIGASGNLLRVTKVAFSAVGGVGSLTVKTGGSGGTAVSPVFTLLQNTSIELDLSPYNVVGDYITLANAAALVHFEGKPST